MLDRLNIREEYYTGEVDLVELFYRPCLANSYQYDRSVGYFRSSVFLLIGPDIIDFAKRGGKIRLVASPCLTEEDIEAITEGYIQRDQAIESAIGRDIEQLIQFSAIKKNTEALATLILTGALEVKIVFLPEASGLYHAKLGVFYDESNEMVSFKGSVNETWAGWHERGNHETLDVFCSWKEGRDNRQVRRNRDYFETLWNGNIKGLDVVDFPDVAREKLEFIAKKSIDDIEPQELIDYFDIGRKQEKVNRSHYQPVQVRKLLPHQEQALRAWKEQGRKGVLEHATGSGKTFTAIAALKDYLGENGVALILVPDRLLHQQWAEEIKYEIPRAIVLKAGNGFNKWRKNNRLRSITQSGAGLGVRVVLATMATARLPDFIEAICGGRHLMVVADEVHEIGSLENSKILSIEAGPRLGLSATPHRYGDTEGTKKIFQFFGGIVEPPFTLVDAISSGRLVEYEYHPEPIRLSVLESDEWEVATKEISREYARSQRDESGKPKMSPRLQNMLIQRSRIAKKAIAKIPYVLKVIKEHYKEGQSWLIYCEDQFQLGEIINELDVHGYSPSEYHSNMSGNQAASLEWFKNYGGIMVSIRCLDQGVDIPKISHAIIVASSQNPRQFIQRRGRVLRTCEGKFSAVIFDAIVVPVSLSEEPGQLSLLKSELQRSIQFSESAINRSGANKLINIAIELGIDPSEVGLIETDGFEEEGVKDGQ